MNRSSSLWCLHGVRLGPHSARFPARKSTQDEQTQYKQWMEPVAQLQPGSVLLDGATRALSQNLVIGCVRPQALIKTLLSHRIWPEPLGFTPVTQGPETGHV